jgi:hypothetical protein
MVDLGLGSATSVVSDAHGWYHSRECAAHLLHALAKCIDAAIESVGASHVSILRLLQSLRDTPMTACVRAQALPSNKSVSDLNSYLKWIRIHFIPEAWSVLVFESRVQVGGTDTSTPFAIHNNEENLLKRVRRPGLSIVGATVYCPAIDISRSDVCL